VSGPGAPAQEGGKKAQRALKFRAARLRRQSAAQARTPEFGYFFPFSVGHFQPELKPSDGCKHLDLCCAGEFGAAEGFLNSSIYFGTWGSQNCLSSLCCGQRHLVSGLADV
jgi:hypothetical protein